MSKKDFDSFLQKQELIGSEKKKEDWEKQKNEWLDYINKFYGMVKNWLKQYKESKRIILRFETIELNEEYIGNYKTKKLYIEMANNEIVFTPIGTLIIGAKGRIDMEGKAGKVSFLLVGENLARSLRRISILGEAEPTKKEIPKETSKWAWKIVTPPPSIRYIDLNEDSFFDALMEVING